MSHYLMTGATGLLGAYLLRDGLRAGDRMAALVRPTRKASARQRIEAILASPKGSCHGGGNGRVQDNGHAGGNGGVGGNGRASGNGDVNRPVVLSGDLTQDDLNLDSPSLDWIAQHCHGVVHNAASLQFHGTDRRADPWETNVEGTRRILNLCRTAGIKHFHYVSTAYVCGLRSGRILEDELDVGQEMGNDYERSKLESERMVREADFFDSVTVYRPAIIVGDSQTGHTTGYHGFFAVLKLAHTLVSRVELGVTNGAALAAFLGLRKNETKHFVPVDWVSAVMTHIRRNPSLHGRTYHLTARQPTRILDMAAVIQEAVERYSPPADRSDPSRLDGDWFAGAFRDQMNIYRAYWRDDPLFDQTNTCQAAPHLPCPHVDYDMLMLMARRAIQSRFGRGAETPRQSRASTAQVAARAATGSSEEV